GRRRRWSGRHDRRLDQPAAVARRSPQDRGRRQRRREDRRVPRGEEARLMAKTLVFLEHHEDAVQKGSLGVLAKFAGADGVLVGSGVRSLAEGIGATVWVADDERLAAPLPQPRVDVLAKLVGDEGYDTVLFAQSVLAADVAAGLAVRLEAGLNWGLVDFDGDQGRAPALQDTVVVDVGWTSDVRIGVFRAGALDEGELSGATEIKDAVVELEEFSSVAEMIEQAHAEQQG